VRRTAPVARRELLEAEFRRRHGLVAAGPEALATVLEGPLAKWRSLDEKGVIARAGIEAMFRRVGTCQMEWNVRRRECWLRCPPVTRWRVSAR
jgi:hypothetical protein